MAKVRIICLLIANFTWGIVQSLLGLVFFIACWNRPHYLYRSSIVTTDVTCKYPRFQGGLSLGPFIFVGKGLSADELPCSPLVKHEYGHTLQSAVLGPLFLPLVGIPSFVWAQCFSSWREKHRRDYYSFYTESWADIWGKSRSDSDHSA